MHDGIEEYDDSALLKFVMFDASLRSYRESIYYIVSNDNTNGIWVQIASEGISLFLTIGDIVVNRWFITPKNADVSMLLIYG